MVEMTILNVGHGSAAILRTTRGVTVFDCGSGPEVPSQFLRTVGVDRIARLVISNFDQDHISDLPGIRELGVGILSRNGTISPDTLESLKRDAGPLTTAMRQVIEMCRIFTHPVAAELYPEPPEASILNFWNSYPRFTDTNNLSLVSFVKWGGNSVLLPGDLEKAGWDALLENDAFVRELAQVTHFVASHHGRENGYSEESLRIARPWVVIFSDGAMEFDTQDMSNEYSVHTSGIPFNGETRRVLTTRADGSLRIR